jgi:LPXTG-motif cell wall-anchored protein
MPRTGENNERFLTVILALGVILIGMGTLIRSRKADI